MTHGRWLLVLLGFCVAALPVAARAATADQAPAAAVAGVWTIDKDSSDVPGAADRGDRPPMGGPGGGMGGPGGGMGGRGGMGGGMPGGTSGGGRRDPEEMRRARGLLLDLSRPPERLTIVHDGAAVILTSDDGRSVKLVVDGKEQERLTGDGVIKGKARWDGDTLRVEEKIQDGPKVVRTYFASSDRRRLVVATRIEPGGGGELVVHHLYTRRD